jgi:hypothetical protein
LILMMFRDVAITRVGEMLELFDTKATFVNEELSGLTKAPSAVETADKKDFVDRQLPGPLGLTAFGRLSPPSEAVGRAIPYGAHDLAATMAPRA